MCLLVLFAFDVVSCLSRGTNRRNVFYPFESREMIWFFFSPAFLSASAVSSMHLFAFNRNTEKSIVFHVNWTLYSRSCFQFFFFQISSQNVREEFPRNIFFCLPLELWILEVRSTQNIANSQFMDSPVSFFSLFNFHFIFGVDRYRCLSVNKVWIALRTQHQTRCNLH